MNLLSFTDKEKKKEQVNLLMKIDRLLSITAFKEKGMNIPEAYIEQQYNKKLLVNSMATSFSRL